MLNATISSNKVNIPSFCKKILVSKNFSKREIVFTLKERYLIPLLSIVHKGSKVIFVLNYTLHTAAVTKT
jgi:serine kinase of HPr protein (carbohydrate metabolism regulator)